MSGYDNTNKGVLFKNERKQGKQPDYNGSINVDGVEKDIAAWLQKGKSGKMFMSLKVSDKYVPDNQGQEQQRPQQQTIPEASVDEEIPF